jgi:hypothetical protein
MEFFFFFCYRFVRCYKLNMWLIYKSTNVYFRYRILFNAKFTSMCTYKMSYLLKILHFVCHCEAKTYCQVCSGGRVFMCGPNKSSTSTLFLYPLVGICLVAWLTGWACREILGFIHSRYGHGTGGSTTGLLG